MLRSYTDSAITLTTNLVSFVSRFAIQVFPYLETCLMIIGNCTVTIWKVHILAKGSIPRGLVAYSCVAARYVGYGDTGP
jgi:hypothetical protein